MQNKINETNRIALSELKENYNKLPWFLKLFYFYAVHAKGNPTLEFIKDIYDACYKQNFFSQGARQVPLIKTQVIPPSFPTDLLVHTLGEFLDTSDMAQLAATNKFYNTLFQPRLRVTQLLVHVVRGQQDEADALLKNHPQLLLERGDVTDCSGRLFKKISAYEYAYWALDTYMCRMLEKHIMVLEPSSREKTKVIMLERINEIEAKGLTYMQDYAIRNTIHFDFTPLIDALTRYVVLHYLDLSGDWASTTAGFAAWMQVGLEQRKAPLHVLQEYCHPDRNFYPLPNFNEDSLQRNGYATVLELEQEGPHLPNLSLLTDSSGLGINFSLVRNSAPDCKRALLLGTHDNGWLGMVSRDVDALRYLNMVRTSELTQLRENLQPAEPQIGPSPRP